MSIIKFIIVLSFLFILMGCGASNVKNETCPPSGDNEIIRLAVTGNSGKESASDFEVLNKIINENSCGLNFELIPPAPGEVVDPANTESLRLFGEDINCLLVFTRNGQENWNVTTVESKLRGPLAYIAPPVTLLKNNEVGLFLSAFRNYYFGRYPAALENFTSLKKKTGNGNNAGDIDFWIALTLQQLGKNKEALSVLKNLTGGGILSGNETKGAIYLAFGELIITEVGITPDDIKKPFELFLSSSELLRGLNSRYWALSQMELGRLTVSSSGNSYEDMFSALYYFDNAGTAFIYPNDELDIALLHFMSGKTYLALARNKKDADSFIDNAITNFIAAKDILIKYEGKLAIIEEIAHQYEEAIELRSE